jgi:hypothetical protein
MLQVSMPTPIIFLNCWSLVAWRQSAWVLHSAKISVLNWQQRLFKLLISVPLVKSHKLLNFPSSHKHNCLAFPKVPSHMQACRRSLHLSRYFILGILPMQGNLICKCSKLETIMTTLGGMTLVVDCFNQVRSQWMYAWVEGLSAGVILC